MLLSVLWRIAVIHAWGILINLVTNSTEFFVSVSATGHSGGLARRETGRFPGGPLLQEVFRAPVVHSHLVYGIEIYANTHMKNINKLVILNNKILRILQNVSRDTHTVELYCKFNALPIPGFHNCQILKLVHKFTHHPD